MYYATDKYLFWKSSIMSAVTCDVILLPTFVASLCSFLFSEDKVNTHIFSHNLRFHLIGSRNWRFLRVEINIWRYIIFWERRRVVDSRKKTKKTLANFLPRTFINYITCLWEIYLAFRDTLSRGKNCGLIDGGRKSFKKCFLLSSCFRKERKVKLEAWINIP